MTERCGLLVLGATDPAGFAAANAYRDREPDCALGIVTDESLLPYRRPPLTKGIPPRRGRRARTLPLADETWLRERSVQLISGRAVAIDVDERAVSLSGGRVFCTTRHA